MVLDGAAPSSTMDARALWPVAVMHGVGAVLCGLSPSSPLAWQCCTALGRKRRRIPVLDGWWPSNTKFGVLVCSFNLKVAKALRLTIAPEVLYQTNRLIR